MLLLLDSPHLGGHNDLVAWQVPETTAQHLGSSNSSRSRRSEDSTQPLSTSSHHIPHMYAMQCSCWVAAARQLGADHAWTCCPTTARPRKLPVARWHHQPHTLHCCGCGTGAWLLLLLAWDRRCSAAHCLGACGAVKRRAVEEVDAQAERLMHAAHALLFINLLQGDRHRDSRVGRRMPCVPMHTCCQVCAAAAGPCRRPAWRLLQLPVLKTAYCLPINTARSLSPWLLLIVWPASRCPAPLCAALSYLEHAPQG